MFSPMESEIDAEIGENEPLAPRPEQEQVRRSTSRRKEGKARGRGSGLSASQDFGHRNVGLEHETYEILD